MKFFLPPLKRFDGDVCAQQLAVGDCRENILSFFYNAETSACEEFYYTGCGGNDNRFASREECANRCAPNRPPGNLYAYSRNAS